MTKLKKDSVNKSKNFYYNVSKWLYAVGAANYWYEDFDIPNFVKKVHDVLATLIDVLQWLFFAATYGSFFTQYNMNKKQMSDTLFFATTNSITYIFIPVLTRNAKKVREVAYNLIVKMKETYNDEEVERHMLKRATILCAVFGILVFSVAIFYTATAVIQVITKDAAFVTVITAWPDIDDKSTAAGVGRAVAYILWLTTMVRLLSTTYFVVIPLTAVLSHQYTNLGSYFRSLNNIFEDDTISHVNQELKYEQAFKIGIGLHSNTLRCTQLVQEICNIVFGIQVVVNVSSLLLFMLQMVNSERTLVNALTTVVTACCILNSTGCLWWNAGDVTVEASQLATAMFSSGWQHCRGATVNRIRPMLIIAMWQAQVPVQLRCVSVVTLSYGSFLTIVKTSYSIFSVLY